MSVADLLPESPSQTAGPYVHIGCTPRFGGLNVKRADPGSCLLSDDTRGERITIKGCIYDGDLLPLSDALVEIWQADASGLYATNPCSDPEFSGWGRCATDLENGQFLFDTIRPGRVPFTDGRMQAPHITLWIVARGINVGLHTRLYFADEAESNDKDPILMQINDRARVDSLIASPETSAQFRFDIYLQGPQETVFFDM
jgi:protocatechuate 3,4-dioxygenase alpha subunit